MDIPLPGEEIPLSEIQPPDIPMPDDIAPPLPQTNSSETDDPNRYSPSLEMEDDDLPLPEPLPEALQDLEPEPEPEPQSAPTIVAPLLPPPPPPPALSLLPTTPAPRSRSSSPSPSPSPPHSPQASPQPARQTRNLVLGKTQAKKRLLAFSMTKQGGGAGVSFNLAKKATINKESAKGFIEEKEEGKKKPPKKGTVDKARDTISEIEELKRKEMQVFENIQAVHPGWGFRDAHSLSAALPLQLMGNLDSLPGIDISGLVGEVLAKKLKRDGGKSKDGRRSKSPSDDRRKSKSKRSDKERSRKKLKLPNNWKEFKKEGHKIRHFRRFKYEVEKNELREKKRHKRSRSRSRSRDRTKKTKSSKRINLLETPMVIKKVLVALDMRGSGDIEYPEHLVHYTKVQPQLSYCENPIHATYHLPSRKTMLSTVPRDIEEIIMGFLNAIRSKRLKPKAEPTEKSPQAIPVINSTKQEDESTLQKPEEACADQELPAFKKDPVSMSCEDNISENFTKEPEVEVDNHERNLLDDVCNENDITSEAQLVQTEVNDRNVEELDKINEADNQNEQRVEHLKDEVDNKIDKESPDTETCILSEVCNLVHRSWYQENTKWMLECISLEDEEDVEIEELDILPSAMNLDQYNDVKKCTNEDPGFDQIRDYKPRSRNVSQSSANVINEELEPIIKSATRSKWDSDYEESDEEKPIDKTEQESRVHSESNQEIVDSNDIKIDKVIDHDTDTAADNLGVVPMEVEVEEEEKLHDDGGTQVVDKWEKEDSKECIQDSQEETKQDSPDVVKKLASEYEEFMKMLSSEENINHIEEDGETVSNLNESGNLETTWDEDASKDNLVHENYGSQNNSSQTQNNSQVSMDVDEEKPIEPVTVAEKQSWESQKQFSNRSRSLSSSCSHIMETDVLKDKLMQEVLFRKRKSAKVQGSKIKKKSKDKYKKLKKKSKKESSSESSSSSSSSSSDSSSSSSSMSSSSEDSSSESSSSSDSTSSTDSSIDLKKLKKQKLKKLKSKLKQKKKKKMSSSDSSDSSDEEIEKKRKRTKSKAPKKKKTKKKFRKNKKNKKLKAITNDSCDNDTLFKKRLKKKRKKSEEEEEDIDNIPKTKKSKLEVQLEDTTLKKGKSGKSKKSSKLNKEKKLKGVSKKEIRSKKKSSKNKSKLAEYSSKDSNSKSLKDKSKSRKGENKEKKDVFLEFGQSPKTSKRSKSSEVALEEDIGVVKETGIKMSEEDFELNTKPRDFEKDCFSTTIKSTKSNIENRNSFLGQNKRLTEEDFDKDLVESIPENFRLNSSEIVKISSPLISKDLEKSKKKSKKEKKKKKDKVNVDIAVDSDKKKRKNKKAKQSKNNSQKKNSDKLTILTSLTEEKNLGKCKDFNVSQAKTNTKEDCIITRNLQEPWNKEQDSKSNISPSCKHRPGPMNNWSDDSETRGFFEKQKNDLVSPQEVFDHSPLRKRNLDLIEVPFIHFDPLSGDRDGSRHNFKKINTEKNINQLDEEFGVQGIVNERDSCFENICCSTAELSPQVLPVVDRDSISPTTDDEDKVNNKVYEESEIKYLKNEVDSLAVNESLVSLTSSFTAQKDNISETNSTEIKLLSEFQEKDIEPVNNITPVLTDFHSPEKDNDNSERYSPTLDMSVMSPCSIEKNGSDMSLDSNGADPGTAIETSLNMLDIPLPPTGLSIQSVPPLPPPLPTLPSPVPPPLLPVPPPSFKNVLNIPSGASFTAQEIKQVGINVEQSKNTEFKTTVTELTPTASTKSMFSDPLKIQISTSLQLGKPVSRLKPINIFEDDDLEDENIGNEHQQSKNKFPFKVNESLLSKTSLDLAVEKVEEGLRQKSHVEKLDLDIVNKLSSKNKLTENANQHIQGILKYDCITNNEVVNESSKLVHNIKPIDAVDKSLSTVTTIPGKKDLNYFTNNENEKSKELEHLSIRKELHEGFEGSSDEVKDNVYKSSEEENLIVKKEVDTNNENIDSSNFNPHLEIKQEPESDVSQEVHLDRINVEESDVNSFGGGKSVLVEERGKKDYEDYRNSRRRDSSRERRDRSRQDLSRERKRNRSRSRSRERRRDRSRERYRRDSLDKRGKKQERSRERSYKISPREKRREKSPRMRQEFSRDRSPRKFEGSNEVRMMTSEKDSFRGDNTIEKRHLETFKIVGEKHAKLASPSRRSLSPYRNKSSPYRSPSPYKRSISPLIKSPLRQNRSVASHFNRSPSPFASSPSRRISGNRPPSPRLEGSKRRLLSPQRRPLSPLRRASPQRRLISPQKRSQSPQWKPHSPKRRATSPQRRHLSPQRRPPSPKSPYRSPYRSPSPYGKHSPTRVSSPTKRYLSPSRRPQSPWRSVSPLKRTLSPSRRSLSPGKKSCSPLKISSSPIRRPLSPWRPPSPPNVQKKNKIKSPQHLQYSGRNPSPLGFKRSLADSTINDSDLPPIKKITRCAMLSPKRLPLDDRIELELGVKKSPPPMPPRIYPGFQSFFQIPVHDDSQLHLQSHRRNTNLVQPPRLDWDASQQLMRGNSTQVVQVGNIIQVVPTEAMPSPVPVQLCMSASVASQVAPVGNILQVVPTEALPAPVPVQSSVAATLASQIASVKPPSSESTVVQVGNMLQVVPSTLVAAVTPSPASVPPTPPPPPSPLCANSPLLLPLPVAKKNIKIDETALRRIEKEKRKREKEMKRQQKLEKQMLRKAMLLKDTYPTMSPALESEDAKLAEEAEMEIEEPPKVMITPTKVKGSANLPPVPEKGILVSPGFRDKPLSEKVRKTVSFADGVQPGEGDEGSAEEHPPSPPPLPKEKRFKKNKKKRKVKVRIIRVEDEGEDDDEEDYSSPPPPPPGSPPPMFHYPPPPPGFMYVPPQSFTVLPGTEGLTSFYQQHHSSTTTTHTTTVQFAPATAPLSQKHAKAK